MGLCFGNQRQPRFRPRPQIHIQPQTIQQQIIETDQEKPTWKNTEPFGPPPIDSGYVVKVYDGDTIWVAKQIQMYNQEPKWYRFNIRVRGIDTPEMRGGDVTEDEKTAAKTARDYLADLIMDKVVELDNFSDADKYGRMLANVYIHGRNVADLMIADRMGLPYSGKTKMVPESWLDFQAGKKVKFRDPKKKK